MINDDNQNNIKNLQKGTNMKELLLELQPIIYQGIVVVIVALGTYLGNKAKQYINYKEMVDIVTKTVHYVEELGHKDRLIKSEEKFNIAKEKAFEWLQERKIPFSEIELEILIEALVNEMRKEEDTNE